MPLELNGVWATYGPRSEPSDHEEAYPLTDIDLTLTEGELCAVLGPNGAGKSTLTKVISGVLPTARGEVMLFGENAVELDRQQVARRVAVVPQRSEVALGFTVREVVAMGRAPHQGTWQRPTQADAEVVERCLSRCELSPFADRPVAELSGGEQKRVHIARALAQQAPILLLDEAAAHLDVRHAVALYELVRSEVNARGLACLAVMHDLNAAAAHADRIVLLKNGRLVADGPVEQVMTAGRLSKTFDVEIHAGLAAGAPQVDGRRYFLPAAATGARSARRG